MPVTNPNVPYYGGHSTTVNQTGPGQYNVGMNINPGFNQEALTYRNALGESQQPNQGGSSTYRYYTGSGGGATQQQQPNQQQSGNQYPSVDPVTGEAVTGDAITSASAGIDPVTGQPITQVLSDDQLMSNQLNGLIAADSPYIQQARQQAMNHAGRRGLGNSTIAGGAGVAAGIQAAAPIAQFDASRIGNIADMNMAAENQMELANMQAQNQFGLADLGALNQMELANMGAENQMEQANIGHLNQGQITNATIEAQMIQAEMQRQSAAASRAAASGNAAAARAHAEKMFDLQQQGALDQMLLGHQFGGLDDYRRHALGTETSQRQMDFNAGQAGLDRDFNYAQLGETGRQFDANYGLANRELDSGIFNNMFQPYFGAMGMIGANPNLDAESMNAVMGNLAGMFPNFSEQAWNSIPPGLFGNQAQGAAASLPPMPNIGGGNVQPPVYYAPRGG